MKHTAWISALAAIAASVTASAPSKACELDLITSVQLTTFRKVPILPVEVNGHIMPFLLDTGAQITIISPASAQAANLPPDKTRISRTRGIMPTTDAWNYDAHYDGLKLGGLALGPGDIHVSDFGDASFAANVSGILGADILSKHDVELDIAHNRVSIYDPKGCIGDFVPWSEPHDRTDAAWTDQAQDQLTIPSSIGDTPVRTFIDTGAANTMITRTAAITAGTDDGAMTAAHPIAGHDATGKTIVGRDYAFPHLQVGNETFADVTLMVCDCTIPTADMQIGEDYLSVRKIWLSYTTGQVFVVRAPADR